MGLGAPKRRNKLSGDPNNLAWSKSTDTYGHRILTAHGWQPGEFLGVENANHSEHYTAANASHVRVLLREDNLGLGAEVGKTNAETFGLSLFSGVLGRLNGKSGAEIQKHQSALRDAELRTYQSQKYGLMRFVRGGVLLGDRIASPPPSPAQPVGALAESQEHKSKKRKAENNVAETSRIKTHRSKKGRSEAKHSETLVKQKDTQFASANGVREKYRRKVLREEHDAANGAAGESSNDSEGSHGSQTSPTEGDEAKNPTRMHGKPRRKQSQCSHQEDTETAEDATRDEMSRVTQEKRARKEERRKRKDENRRLEVKKQAEPLEADKSSNHEELERTSSGIPTFSGSRHAVRQRYIQQKRMASSDPKAMREIFMLKADA